VAGGYPSAATGGTGLRKGTGMPQEISPRVFALASLLFYLANAYIQGNLRSGGQSAWLMVVAGAVLLLPFFLLLSAVSSRHPGKDLPAVAGQLWGMAGQRVVSGLLFLYGTLLLGRSLSCFTRFVSAYILPDTPRILMATLLFALAALLVRRGAAAIGRWAGIVLPVVFLMIGLAIAASISVCRPEALMPIETERGKWLRGIRESVVFPFGEPLAMCTLLTGVKGTVRRRHWVLPWLGAALLLALTFARNTMVLGGELSAVLPFATHHADSVMGYSSFSLRVEALTSLIPAAAGILEAAVFLHLAVCSMEAMAGRKLHGAFYLIPAGLAGAIILLPGGQLMAWEGYWGWFSLPLQAALPVALLLGERMQKRMRRKILARRLKRGLE